MSKYNILSWFKKTTASTDINNDVTPQLGVVNNLTEEEDNTSQQHRYDYLQSYPLHGHNENGIFLRYQYGYIPQPYTQVADGGTGVAIGNVIGGGGGGGGVSQQGIRSRIAILHDEHVAFTNEQINRMYRQYSLNAMSYNWDYQKPKKKKKSHLPEWF